MTYEEKQKAIIRAKKWIQDVIDYHQDVLNDEEPDDMEKAIFEECEVILNALEKQIPKKPRKTDSYRGVLKRVYAYVCPTCGNACLEKYMNERQNTMFCWNCGQKLDWSEEKTLLETKGCYKANSFLT